MLPVDALGLVDVVSYVYIAEVVENLVEPILVLLQALNNIRYAIQVKVPEVHTDLTKELLCFIEVASERSDFRVRFFENRFEPVHLIVDVLEMLK